MTYTSNTELPLQDSVTGILLAGVGVRSAIPTTRAQSMKAQLMEECILACNRPTRLAKELPSRRPEDGDQHHRGSVQ